ncbi:MAG: redoxin domain-containing protein [Halobacteriales archaeon]
MDLGFDVVSMPEADAVEVGETAPDFTRPLVTAEYWEDRALSELTAGGPVLLVFHPMAGSFPATYVWQEIADRGWDDHATVVGVSISTPYAHRALIRERGLGDGDYGLFSDPDNGVAEAYGIENDLDGMAGVSEPRPAAYLLEPDRTVTYAWVADQWPAFPDYDEIEDALSDRRQC